MTLLNIAAMFAAVAVIVPVLIHLQKRRRSKVIEWPAMQFLTRTVASRRRGLMLEHLVLLFLRCLIVLLFVLAMARPVVEFGRYIEWFAFCFLAGGALLTLAASLVVTASLRRRLAGVFIAAILFAGAGAMLTGASAATSDSGVDRDVAIVIDRSLTMNLGGDPASHFDHAVSQAKSLVRQLSGTSTVSIVLAGPVTETIAGSPFRNLRAAEHALGSLSPVSGGSDLGQAFKLATSLLQKAPNLRKQVLLLTDNQLRNWESVGQSPHAGPSSHDTRTADSQYDTEGSAAVEANDTGPASATDLVYSALVARLPQNAANLSVDRVRVLSALVTANRTVPIEVEVRNGGSTTVRDVQIQLIIDNRQVQVESLSQLEPGVSSNIRFLHAFQTTGTHTVSAAIEFADLITEDNRCDAIVAVIPHLSVLLVNGNAHVEHSQQSATFAQLALNPAGLNDAHPLEGVSREEEKHVSRAIETTSIEAAHLGDIDSLRGFHIVLLCDVPRLPARAAEQIAAFVNEGGGLWIIPGDQTDAAFYNNWRFPLTDDRIMPATIDFRSEWAGKVLPNGQADRLGVAMDVAGQPFISSLFESGKHDLSEFAVCEYWNTNPADSAIVAMRLTNGAPLFLERALGKGRVLLQSVSLHPRDSNLAARFSFPVLMHLWTHQLAAAQEAEVNFEPTADLTVDLAFVDESGGELESLRLTEPSGANRTVEVVRGERAAFAQVGKAADSGVYRLSHPQSDQLVASFTIARDLAESELTIASDERLRELSAELDMELIDDVQQLTSFDVDASNGQEVWDVLVFLSLWLLAAESLVSMWVRKRRAVSESFEPKPRTDRPGTLPPVLTAGRPSLWLDECVDERSVMVGGRR